MATLTFSLASTPVTGSKVFTLSDAHVTRWIAAQKARYGTGLTNAQVLAAWADDEMESIKNTTLSFEKRVASDAIAPITTT